MKDLDCLEHLGMQDIQLQWGTLKKKIQNQENTIVNTWIKFTGSFQVVLATKITFFNYKGNREMEIHRLIVESEWKWQS